MRNTSLRFGASLFALSTVLVLGACDDDPVSNEEEHHEPVGMVISSGGVDLVTVNGSTVTGSLTYAAGAESPHLDVEFLADDGDRFTPEDADEWLRVTIADTDVAEWEQDEPGEFGGHVHGESAGSTVAVFDLMHGAVNSASAHADYTSPNVPIVIN